MRHRSYAAALAASLCAAALGIGVAVLRAQDVPPTAPADDPFALLRTATGQAALTPPRALAVIPERHVGRLLRVQDVLLAIDPQFDDLSRGAGLDGRRAIQLRTREANLPIFVAKTQTSIATVLQLELGARVEVEGVLVERGARYLFLASVVRPASAPGPAANRPR
jgi:hypothetical protein